MKITRRELRQIIAESIGSINPFRSAPKMHKGKTFEDAKAAAEESGKSYFVQPRRGAAGDEVIEFDMSNGQVRANVLMTQGTAQDAMDQGDGDVYVHRDATSVDRSVT